MTEEIENKKLTGYVKWFDPSKGFGFVVADEGGPDILLHANVLRNFGQSSVADNAGIEILVQETDRGIQTTEILHISPPDNDGEDVQDGGEPTEPLNVEDLEPARVKWFRQGQGFWLCQCVWLIGRCVYPCRDVAPLGAGRFAAWRGDLPSG